MQIKTTVIRHNISTQNGKNKKGLTTNTHWQGHEATGTLTHCWWECKMAQPLWKKKPSSFLKKKNYLTIPLLGIYARERIAQVYKRLVMAPHSSTLAWKIPRMEEPGRLESMGLLRIGHNWATSLSLFTFMHWRRKWQPTPVFLPGESQGQRSLVGCRLWGRTESDTTEVTWRQQQQHKRLAKECLGQLYLY